MPKSKSAGTRKNCTAISYNCGAICLSVAKTCRKGGSAIGKDRIAKLKALATALEGGGPDTRRGLGKAGAAGLEDLADQIQDQRRSKAFRLTTQRAETRLTPKEKTLRDFDKSRNEALQKARAEAFSLHPEPNESAYDPSRGLSKSEQLSIARMAAGKRRNAYIEKAMEDHALEFAGKNGLDDGMKAIIYPQSLKQKIADAQWRSSRSSPAPEVDKTSQNKAGKGSGRGKKKPLSLSQITDYDPTRDRIVERDGKTYVESDLYAPIEIQPTPKAKASTPRPSSGDPNEIAKERQNRRAEQVKAGATMSLEDYVAKGRESGQRLGASKMELRELEMLDRQEHKRMVSEALRLGLPVSDAAIAKYPELKAKKTVNDFVATQSNNVQVIYKGGDGTVKAVDMGYVTENKAKPTKADKNKQFRLAGQRATDNGMGGMPDGFIKTSDGKYYRLDPNSRAAKLASEKDVVEWK